MAKIKIYNPQTIVHARTLRKTQTPHEAKLWYYLRSKRFQSFKFRRQFPIGKYIVDICCVKAKLIIELDGGQHNEEHALKYDEDRDRYLQRQGYRILRIWNNEMDNNLEGVLERIYQVLTQLL
jgi:very-short-patch-repair endonuclease